jgi:Carbohydrate-binding family 9
MNSITLTKNHWHSLPQTTFRHATDGSVAWQETVIRLRYDDTYLYVEFECKDNPFTHQNTYSQHNSDMWNQEVFEMFITDELENPQRYLEFEINPNNAIWVGRIHNPTGLQHIDADTQMILHQETGIVHQVDVNTKTQSWSGRFQIPFLLIGNRQSEYRLNFYRIISTQSHSNPDWVCSTNDCLFLCWNPTMSGDAPAFHRPAAFGRLAMD